MSTDDSVIGYGTGSRTLFGFRVESKLPQPYWPRRPRPFGRSHSLVA